MNRPGNIQGYTLVELMLAIVAGAVILAGTFASYTLVNTQYQNNQNMSDIHSFAVPTLKILNRDLRMAGYKSVDSNLQATIGIITTPIEINDSGNACCDSVKIIFDKDATTRKRYTYFVAARSNPSRNALFLNIENYSSGTWVAEKSNEVVADYVDDFQVTGSDLNSSGFPTLVDISLVLRAKMIGKTVNSFGKPSYSTGNYNYLFNDNYQRAEFSTTVLLRNILQKNY